ncbi:MAG: hypothetical protein ACI9QL_002670 [Candidatus Omnitrophota bacterium]|jgi:hypothetical protein
MRMTIQPPRQRTAALRLLLLAFGLAPFTASANMTKAIEGVSPRIGQQGTTVEITLVGVSLHEPREIIFFKPGIRAFDFKTPDTPPRPRGMAHGGRIAESVVCSFEIAPDCPPGEHPFRLRTATELTCVGTFHVSRFPVIDEEEQGQYGNDTRETAKPVMPNVTVRAKLGGGSRGEVDIFQVEAKAGQHLSVEVEAAGLADVHYGGSEYDLALRILDAQGKELAANDDNAVHIQDPMASVLAARDGPLFVEVKRSVFVSSEIQYAIHIGTNPQPVIAFPPGGPSGTVLKVALAGDPSGVLEKSVQVPDTLGSFAYFGDAPSPLTLRSCAYPNLLEEPSAKETHVPTWPIALNGRIDRHDDTDTYRITVQKGVPLHIRVYSAALGSPLDPRISLRPITGDETPGAIEIVADDASLQDRDIFGTSYRSRGGQIDILDPSILWEPKSDGDYLLEIADNSGAGGTTGVYRIEIEPPRTVVQTVLQSQTFDWTESVRVTGLAVPQGNRWMINLNLPGGQWQKIQGEYDLIAHGLPEGVRLVSPRVKANMSRWPIQLVADASAKPGGAVITLEAIPVDPTQNVETRSQQNVPFINHSGGDAWRAVRMDQYVMAVTDPAPFTLDIEQPTMALVRGGELPIVVKVKRREGFNEPIEFRAGWVHGAIDTQPATILPAGEDQGELRLSARPNAPLETLPFVVVGTTVNDRIDDFLGAGHVRVSSDIVQLTVAEPYVELAAEPESVRRGERKGFTWNVRHKSPFAGSARVKLTGLPKGVHALDPLPVLTKDSTEITFQIEASDEALLGRVSGLVCEVFVRAGDQEISQRTGQGTLRIDPKL